MVIANRPWGVFGRFAAALHLLFVFLLLLPLSVVHAVPAGTILSNTANINFDVGGIPIATVSNTVNITATGSIGSPGEGPTPGVLLTKTTSTTSVSIGDVLQYQLRFDNTGSGLNLTGVLITDTLPPGLRYKTGSTKIDGVSVSDPAISSNGHTLTFSLGNVSSGSTVEVRYVVEVIPGARNGKLTNTAVITADAGVSSNRSEASVQVKDELFTRDAFLEGRVIIDSCDPQGVTGLKGARIYLEDGTYVNTDEEGKWHIEGVKPGTHIVQLDTDSLPEEYEAVLCEDHTRHADTAFSQFVDVQGGTLWRADFYVRTRPDSIFRSPNNRLNFVFGKDEVTTASDSLLGNMADKIVKDNTGILIEGHTDSIGSDEYNRDLSERRALRVAEKLEEQGVSEDQIELQAYGAAKPAADNSLLDGRAANRRVDINKNPEGYDPLRKAQEKVMAAFEQKDAKKYDVNWLNQQNNQFSWVYPDETFNPVTPAAHIGIKHRSEYKVQLFVNGEAVNGLNFAGTETNTNGTIALSRWRGVNLQDGNNTVEAALIHNSGKEINRISRIVHYSGEAVKAEFVTEKSILVADGKQNPVVAIRLTDKEGYPARPGTIGYFTVNDPYRTEESMDDQIEGRLIRSGRASKFFIGKNGIALLKLQPTTQTGEAVVQVKLAENEYEDIRAWLSPGTREWIFVGLAEAQVGEHMVSGDDAGLAAADLESGSYDENRVAFFAKGQIKGEWLLTAAYDTDKDKDQRFRQVIDPDTYYTLYGDNTAQAYDAASTEKLYLKMEKKDFYALFGDYDTGLNKTELGDYSRSITGLKSELRQENWRTSFFAAETGQSYLRDEIRGDGTSGLYQLSRQDIVLNTDKITIETRDRFRSEKIISSESMTRNIDYNIDVDSGTIYFRKAIPANDNQQNPVYIVAEYESESDGSEDITAGGRAAYHLSEDTYAGITAIHEGTTGAEGDLTSFDASYELTDSLIVKTEFATSEKEVGINTLDGDAYLVEFIQDGEKLDASLYVREQDEGFGLGQQNVGEGGTRKTGIDTRYSLSNEHSLNGEMYQEKDLVNNATRDVMDATYDYENDGTLGYVGARQAQDKYDTGEKYSSSQLLLGASTNNLMDKKLTLSADSEIVLESDEEEGESSDFPNRLELGADYRLNKAVDLLLGQEFSWGDQEDYQGSSVGMRLRPWQGMETSTEFGKQSGEFGDRTFANLGMNQQWEIDDAWRMDFGMDRSQTLSETSTPQPIASFNDDDTEDFTAYNVGVGYITDIKELAVRMENRHADTEEKTNLFMGYLHKLNAGLSMSVGMALSDADRINDETYGSGDVRYSIAYRPVQSAWHYFNRLDYLWDEQEDPTSHFRSRRLVNNLMSNYKPDLINQLSFQYGIKYNLDNIDEEEYDGLVDLYGMEYRRNMPRIKRVNWDIGTHAHMLNSWETNTRDYSWGLSAGFSPQTNVWVSVGYNFEGFSDEDFSGSDYTAKGAYLKFRMKVDQESLRDLWAK